MAVTQLYLYKKNGNDIGGGKAVLTGPSFVDKTNIDTDPAVHEEQHPLDPPPRGPAVGCRSGPRRTARSRHEPHPSRPTHRRRRQPRPPTGSPLGLSNRLLARPEIGALVAAIVIFIFFLIVAPAFRAAGSFFTVLYQSSTIGIVAVGVGMLMIGGEFDLSAGVAGDHRRPAERRCSATSSASTCGSARSCRWSSALLIGFLNGYLVMRTGIPSFLITLGHVLRPAGRQPGRDQARHRLGRPARTSTRSTASTRLNGDLRPRRSTIGVGHRLKITVIWWLLFVALVGLDAAAHPDRQLDLRRRRQRRLAPARSVCR